MITNIIVAILSSSHIVTADINDKVCDDLYRVTCLSGEYDDGTGTARNPGPLEDSVRDKALTYQKNIEELIRNKLSIPSNDHFRKIALSASGIATLTECQSAIEPGVPSKACLDLLTKGVSEIAIGDLIINEGYAYGGMLKFLGKRNSSKISDKTLLIESSEYREVREQFISDFKKQIGMNELEKKIRDKVFPQVKSLLLKKIELMVSDENIKKQLTAKIRAIRFDGSHCGGELSSNRESIPGLLVPNALYQSKTNTFKYCSGYIQFNNSEFQMAHTIAHELTHAIDPCLIETGPSDFTFKYTSRDDINQMQDEFPFPSVLKCLRSIESVGAKRRDPKLREGNNLFDRDTDIYDSDSEEDENHDSSRDKYLSKRSSTKKSSRQLSFCKKDQITESFSDYMATEIVPDYIEANFPKLTKNQYRTGYSNIWRGGCDSEQNEEDPAHIEVHPEVELRANKIILPHPKVRLQMGCPTTIKNGKYCVVGSKNVDTSELPQNIRSRKTRYNDSQKGEETK